MDARDGTRGVDDRGAIADEDREAVEEAAKVTPYAFVVMPRTDNVLVAEATNVVDNDAPEQTYKAGESWTEKPGDHHQVSHNASDTEPAKLLAIFVVDTSDAKIVIPVK